MKYLRTRLDGNRVSVSFTPDGYADAIRDNVFVQPLEEDMDMGQFLDILEAPPDPGSVPYIQKQNSNLSEQFNALMDDVGRLPWAEEAFGKEPDAINFWMGDQRAVTSSKPFFKQI